MRTNLKAQCFYRSACILCAALLTPKNLQARKNLTPFKKCFAALGVAVGDPICPHLPLCARSVAVGLRGRAQAEASHSTLHGLTREIAGTRSSIAARSPTSTSAILAHGPNSTWFFGRSEQPVPERSAGERRRVPKTHNYRTDPLPFFDIEEAKTYATSISGVFGTLIRNHEPEHPDSAIPNG